MSEKKLKTGKYSGFAGHTTEKKKLTTGFSKLPVEPVSWERDFLPEHLWVAALCDYHGPKEAPNLFHKFMDAYDEALPSDVPRTAVGLICDFELIETSKRDEFLKKNRRLVEEAFITPFASIISYYPSAPCSWLLADFATQLDFDTDLQELIGQVMALFEAKDAFCNMVRMLPVARRAKAGKLHLPSQEIVDYFVKYPGGTEHERYMAESISRSHMQLFFRQYISNKWSKEFWQQNQKLAVCTPLVKDEEFDADPKEFEGWQIQLVNTISDYIQNLSQNFPYDIYSPERDEVILGLFTRIARILVFMSTDLDLMTQDMGGIALRCLTDTAITLNYLIICGTQEEFQSFIDYGKGRQKLQMMHLQDNYEGTKSLKNESVEDLANAVGGGLLTELAEVNLANWTKKGARELAQVVGLEKWYRLIYDPTSAEVHGMWHSIQDTNMTLCLQPLHRGHKIPFLHAPVANLNYLVAAQDIFEKTLEKCISAAKFPKLDGALKKLQLKSQACEHLNDKADPT